jgi:hypothetical protein
MVGSISCKRPIPGGHSKGIAGSQESAEGGGRSASLEKIYCGFEAERHDFRLPVSRLIERLQR